MDDRPDCYKCKHRGSLAGDAHSRCKHPDVKLDSNPIGALVEVIQGKAREVRRKLRIKGGGSVIGWPANFNPVFLENCEGFELRESGE